jgi:hypothetical protein
MSETTYLITINGEPRFICEDLNRATSYMKDFIDKYDRSPDRHYFIEEENNVFRLISNGKFSILRYDSIDWEGKITEIKKL